MQSIGLLSVVLFLASLASFMIMFFNESWTRTGGIVGLLLLAAAVGVLAVTIKKRNSTERI